MKNIEERAKALAETLPKDDDNDVRGLVYHAYKYGAEAQQKIDTEKVCKWLKDNGCFSYLQEDSQTIEDIENMFRKVMEE